MEFVIKKIKRIRIIKGYSHENMAHDLNISQAAYTKLESSQTQLSVERLYQIAGIFQIPVTELLHEEINPSLLNDNNNLVVTYQKQIEHLQQNNKETYIDLINTLKEEIRHLKQQNHKLLEAFTQKS